MIRVYFETDSVSEQVATFESESHYIACLPVLEELAKQEKWARVTESDEPEYEYHEEDSVSIMDMKEQVWQNLYGEGAKEWLTFAHIPIQIKERDYVSLKYSERNYAENIITTKSEGGERIENEDSKHRPNKP